MKFIFIGEQCCTPERIIFVNKFFVKRETLFFLLTNGFLLEIRAFKPCFLSSLRHNSGRISLLNCVATIVASCGLYK